MKEVDTDAQHQLTARRPARATLFRPGRRTVLRSPSHERSKGRRSVLDGVRRLGGPEKTDRGTKQLGVPPWLPDGKSMVLGVAQPVGRDLALVLHVLESGDRKQLTEAPVGFSMDYPTVSPDGKAGGLRQNRRGPSGGVPRDAERRRTDADWSIGSAASLAGSVLDAGRPLDQYGRIRRRAAGGWFASRLAVGSLRHRSPASRSCFAAGFDLGARALETPIVSPSPADSRTSACNWSICTAPLRAAQRSPHATLFDDTTRMDVPGRFSPDASLVAFVSD